VGIKEGSVNGEKDEGGRREEEAASHSSLRL